MSFFSASKSLPHNGLAVRRTRFYVKPHKVTRTLWGFFMPTTPTLERDPGYWWLRLTYAIRDEDERGIEQAQRSLSALGVDVAVRSPESFRLNPKQEKGRR